MKTKTSNLAPDVEIASLPPRPGRTISSDPPVHVESAMHNALAHMIEGLHAAWSDGGTTVGYFHDVQFKARAIEEMLEVLLSEMNARGARETEDE